MTKIEKPAITTQEKVKALEEVRDMVTKLREMAYKAARTAEDVDERALGAMARMIDAAVSQFETEAMQRLGEVGTELLYEQIRVKEPEASAV